MYYSNKNNINSYYLLKLKFYQLTYLHDTVGFLKNDYYNYLKFFVKLLK